MKIFSIKNEQIGFFNRPIYCESEAEALSYIQNVLMSDADRALLGLKDQLALYYLGDIDFTTGLITPPMTVSSDPSEFGTTYSKLPVFVCGLLEIFNMIPEDRVPQTAKQLSKRIDNLVEHLDAIDECMKEVKSHDDSCASCRNYRSKAVRPNSR